MKASETPLQPMIEGAKQYVVPLFQRPYSWGPKEWGILWEDLADLCEADKPRNHFIGSIVTMQTISVPQSVTKYLLIDGQQRLTTLFILLALTRNVAKERGDIDLAEEINNTLLINPYKKDLDQFKLLPTQVDRAAFANIIHPSTLCAMDQLTIAYRYFDTKLRRSTFNANTLKRVISENLAVVSIVLDKEDNPYLVFESLNAKGRPLTQSDLIRNYFFLRIHHDDQELMHDSYWKPMERALENNLTEYIRHYLMKDGLIINQAEVYFTLKEQINQADALDFLKELAQFASYYQKLLDPTQEPEPAIRKALTRLNRLEITTAFPFLLNCYKEYDLKMLCLDDFVRVLDVAENYLLRRFICNVPTNQLRKIFPPLYRQSKSSEFTNLLEGVKAVLQSKGYPKDAEFRDMLVEARLYGGGDRTRKTKLILERIEEAHGHKESVDFESLTVEHVMPQTLNQVWRDHLGPDCEEMHELFLHTIGNLTLTGYNPEMSNEDYTTKRKRLGASHLEINKYFQNVLIWTGTEIEMRATHLADIALGVWPYFGRIKPETDADRAFNQSPCQLSFLGRSWPVQTWRDVLEETLNAIAEQEPEKFEQVIKEFPRYFRSDGSSFRASRQLRNGTFVNTHFSANDIKRFCKQVIGALELDAEEWKVEVK